ncbi:putative ABC transport system ATP-binding protein [Lachnospiraceae bacterium NK3A20]|jgi:putative ABC transport system ATP-binding protein|nr:putative ABC transport system ATP-binding protein [Lachnospiraceae bacterium NK3A20]
MSDSIVTTEQTSAGRDTSAKVILRMEHINKDYEMPGETLHVLKDVSLTVHEGEFLAILGPSGSGKSTLMNIIGCLDLPTSGDYWLDGKYIFDEDETTLAQIRSKEIGFIFQSFYLLQRQTAFQNVELPLIYADLPEKQRKARVEECLARVDLSDKMYNLPNQLSGGQQQRVAIARAVANHPAILLADEPTGALDQKTGAQVMQLFHELNEEGNTIIMITHDGKIAAHAKRIVKILDGVISEGALEDA